MRLSPRTLLRPLLFATVALVAAGCAEITGPTSGCQPRRDLGNPGCAEPLFPLIPLSSLR
jgi:hypothetical protein